MLCDVIWHEPWSCYRSVLEDCYEYEIHFKKLEDWKEIMNNLVPVSDIEKMANAVSKSKLFGIKTAEEAMSLMLIAQAEGLHPAIAARDYHIINGKPSLKADAMLARFQTAGGSVKWNDYTDTKCNAVISHPQGGSVTVEWTIEMAKKIGLTKNNTWQNYPRQMLRARVISEGIRTVYPGVAVGIYTPEEVQDFNDKTMVDITPTEVDHSKPKSQFSNATRRKEFQQNIAMNFHNAKSHKELTELMEMDKTKLVDMEASGAEADHLSLGEIRKQFQIAWNRLAKPVPVEDNTFDEEELPAYLNNAQDSGLLPKAGV